MLKRMSGIIAIAALSVGTSAYAYDFWGIHVDKATYRNSYHTTFDGVVASGAQYVVGGWKYNRVDGGWTGAHAAPIPGEGYLASRRSDAQGLFFKGNSSTANFVIIATSAQTGQGAPELGYDKRMFGPGDLRIDVGGQTYGIGLRVDNLLWAQNPAATGAQYQIYGTDNQVMDMNSRDAGTLGDVEVNPTWGRVGNQSLAVGSNMASAFYVSGTGSSVGNAVIDYIDTGVSYNGAHVYAYSVSVPWAAIGVDPRRYSFTASWRPDCGNDLISGSFTNSFVGVSPVPEPSCIVTLAGGILASLAGLRKR